MGIFSRFEGKVEDTVEGAAGSLSRAPISPVQISKRCERQMVRNKMVGAGKQYAPTLFTVLVNPDDDSKLYTFYPTLAGEIETYLRAKAGSSGLYMDGQPLVRFIVDDKLKHGKFDVIAEVVASGIIAQLRAEENEHYALMRQEAARAQAVAGAGAVAGGVGASGAQDAQQAAWAQAQAGAGTGGAGANGGYGNGAYAGDAGYGNDYAGSGGYSDGYGDGYENGYDNSYDNGYASDDPYAPQYDENDPYAPSDMYVGSAGTGMSSANGAVVGAGVAGANGAVAGASAVAGVAGAGAMAAGANGADFNNGDVTQFFDNGVGDAGGANGSNASTGAQPAFHLISSDGSTRFELTSGKLVAGRASDNDIVIPDINASRKHAEFSKDIAGRWVIRDLGSKNGTLVNGEFIQQPTVLYESDQITVGLTKYTFTQH